MWIRARFLSITAFAGVAVGLSTFAPVSRAQNTAAVEDVLIETYDGVKLRGKQYTGANKGKNNSVVIIMHAYQKEPSKGDLGGLAKKLAGEGYHVLQFDFRFHGGKPMDVTPGIFWNDPFNKQHIKGATNKPPRSELTLKDIKTPKDYYPMLVNDVMAARTYLDAQNDLGKVNTSTVYLIGAGDAASIGFLYMTAEWYREREVPNIPIPPVYVSTNRGLFPNSQSCGGDIAGAVWLSPARHPSMSQNTIENFTSKYQGSIRLREETPMLFISGEKDAKGKEGAKFFFDKVLVAQPKSGSRLAKLPLTYNREVKSTILSEAELLGKGLETETMITEFLTAIDKDRKNKVAIPKRGYTKPLPVQFQSFGVTQ